METIAEALCRCLNHPRFPRLTQTSLTIRNNIHYPDKINQHVGFSTVGGLHGCDSASINIPWGQNIRVHFDLLVTAATVDETNNFETQDRQGRHEDRHGNSRT